MVAVRVLTLGILLALSVGGVPRAQADVQAPGYSSGPKVVSGGLLWSDYSSGREDVLLSTATGTRVLAADAELSQVSVDDGWVVVGGGPSGPRVGRIGRRLTAVPGLRGCPPLRELEAVANGELYAIVRARCLSRLLKKGDLLVDMRLGGRHLHAIGRVPADAISLAAAGSRLALTYRIDSGNRVRVDVLHSRTARVLYHVAAPPREHRRYRDTQIDAKGDVLVNTISGNPLGKSGAGWWATPHMRVGEELEAWDDWVAASLWEGRIAYSAGASIKLMNVVTGNTRTLVTFSRSARVEGLALGKTRFAWAQQRYGYKLSGSPSRPCVLGAGIGPTELVEAPLSQSGPPVAVDVPVPPRPAGQGCVLK
jgi:hypothetical protein